jgi:hypothetical protein
MRPSPNKQDEPYDLNAISLLAFGFPLPVHGLAISFKFHFALDRIAAHFTAVLVSHFRALDFSARAESDFVAF